MKNLGYRRESNPGLLALATSTLTTQLRATGFSHQYSNHSATTTLNFQDLHIFPLYCGVVPLAAVSYSTDHQLCAVRTPFQCWLKTPPPPERSHNLWIEKALIITIIKFWPFIQTRLKLGQNLIIVMIKSFQSTNCGSYLEGEVFPSRHRKGALTAHNWWSVEYKIAASGTTQQYKGKMWRSWKSKVVVAQWLEHWWLNPVVLGSIPGDNQDFCFFFFPLLFSRPL